MKALPFQIPKTQNLGLVYQEDIENYFYDTFHQHNEIQISIIIEGKGTLIIGDTITNYISNDIIIIGSNIPHVFKSDFNDHKKSFMISLFFTEKSFGKEFFSLDDFKELQVFFKKSLNGFKIINNKELLKLEFLNLRKATYLERFIGLFKILKLFTKTETKILTDFVYPKKYSINHGKRMQTVINYTIDNFSNNINLIEIANKANMTPNAFCRYFKQRTNKTYFTFLNELKIENACKLLKENKEITVSEIAYQCGFSNLSNFNRKFMEIKSTTPSKYRKN